MLLLALFPDARPVTDPVSGNPIKDANDRVKYLIERLDDAGATILIPTPVLAEVLIKAGPMIGEIIQMLNTSSAFEVADFDQVAAVECAVAMADAIRRGGLKVDAITEQVSKSKVKFDRQIAAIAKVRKADVIYSDDGDLHRIGSQLGIEVIKTADLPSKPDPAQQSLNFSDD